jgi:hypothetical protein
LGGNQVLIYRLINSYATMARKRASTNQTSLFNYFSKPQDSTQPRTPITDVKTDYVLDKLLETFDTTKILSVVEMIDEIAARAGNLSGLRDDLLKFYALANRVISQGPISPSPELLEELEDGAEALSMELAGWAERLHEASTLLESLSIAQD